jgi:hypothetical protein
LSYKNQLQECFTRVLNPDELCMGPVTFSNRTNQVMLQIKNNSDGKTAVEEMSVRMQWDPGISTATTWGQAVFRGAGNVMTRMWIKRSPAVVAAQSKAQAKGVSPIHVRSATQERDGRRNKIRIVSGCSPSCSSPRRRRLTSRRSSSAATGALTGDLSSSYLTSRSSPPVAMGQV